MEARSRPELPDGPGWWYEPKWDGFRCLAFRAGSRVELVAKSGKLLNRFFPEVVQRLSALPDEVSGLDGKGWRAMATPSRSKGCRRASTRRKAASRGFRAKPRRSSPCSTWSRTSTGRTFGPFHGRSVTCGLSGLSGAVRRRI
jgi:hypothetical protein